MTTKSLRTEPQKRLDSLDALRGFDMFWITGGGYLFVTLSQMFGWGWVETQLHHVPWEGFHFYDLIFPLFMFISGVAIPFSIKSKLEKNVPKKSLAWKAFKRMLVLILLGILYNGAFKRGFTDARIASVLGQIGIAYFFASLIVIYFKSFRSRLYWLAGILTGFGIIQLLIPVPGYGAGVLTVDGSINAFIDQLMLPGRPLFDAKMDPEGIISSLSATAVTLMGTIAGNILRKHKTTDWQKMGYLAGAGVASIVLALVLSTFYPIIKNMWTSSFNLLAGGISFLLVALFYMIIDIWGYKKWSFYFRVIGMNSIFIYLFTRIVDEGEIAQYFIGWITNPMGEAGKIPAIIGNLVLVWLLLYYMYKKKIFLRV
jgi:predicted acyltransferase